MGLESNCSLVRGRTRIEGKALLETDHLLFRGDGERTKVMLGTATTAEERAGKLVLTHEQGTVTLVLPDGVAAKWLSKIRNPRGLLDKLGVAEGARVAVIDMDDASFLEQLRQRTDDITGAPKGERDLIFLGAESAKALTRLADLRKRLVPNGAIWVVHRKGKDATLKDIEVFAAAKRAGLVDTKVASFSATHTAEKLVIPLAQRESAPKKR
jgi:hypothetical protein